MGLSLLAIYHKGIIKEKLEEFYITELFNIIPLLKASRFLGLFIDLHQFFFERIPDAIEVINEGLMASMIYDTSRSKSYRHSPTKLEMNLIFFLTNYSF